MIFEKLSAFYQQCKRVWVVLKKPEKREYWTIAKVSALGILILGVFGFFLSLIMKVFIR